MQPMRMSSFATMGFDQARDALHQDAGHSLAQTMLRTMSAPARGGATAIRELPFFLGGPTIGMSPDELQTLLLDANQPQWTPASEQDIWDLPKVTIEQRHLAAADTKLCSVCQDDFTIGERVTVLTCDHLFHEKCITPWLKKNRTCPLCRKEVVNVRAEQLEQRHRRARPPPPPPLALEYRHQAPTQRYAAQAQPAGVSYYPRYETVGRDYQPGGHRVAPDPSALPPLYYPTRGGTPAYSAYPEPLYRSASYPSQERSEF